MDRTVFITLMIALPVIDLVILAVGALTLKGFRSRHPKIATQAHLDNFKKMVKLHKYLALASIPILWTPSALFLLGLFMDQLEIFWDILLTLVPSAIIIGAAKLLNGLQSSVEELPVTNDALKQERDRVIGVWHNQALPDW